MRDDNERAPTDPTRTVERFRCRIRETGRVDGFLLTTGQYGQFLPRVARRRVPAARSA